MSSEHDSWTTEFVHRERGSGSVSTMSRLLLVVFRLQLFVLILLPGQRNGEHGAPASRHAHGLQSSCCCLAATMLLNSLTTSDPATRTAFPISVDDLASSPVEMRILSQGSSCPNVRSRLLL